MWPSTSPPTRPYGERALDGVPVALRSASGNVAQPAARLEAHAGDRRAPDRGVSVNVAPVSSTAQSAAGLGARGHAGRR